MTTKERLLDLFEKNKGIYFSGEQIARELNVSRSAVWKNVKALRNEGYSISAVTNKGYALSENTDILSISGIRKYLEPVCDSLDINVFDTVDSTNDLVKKKASEGAFEGYVALSSEQTKGRGRHGRVFYSPDSSGLYMSILLRPLNTDVFESTAITTMAAVAVCEAIKKAGGENPQIKWVNDVFMNKKKVCGILTEASFDLETTGLEYAVLGVGINIYPPKDGFPEEIENIAGAVFSERKPDIKNLIASEFLNRFMYYYKNSLREEYTEKYREYNLCIGKRVTVLLNDSKKEALCYGIDDKCRLLIKYDDSTTQALSYGEIKVENLV